MKIEINPIKTEHLDKLSEIAAENYLLERQHAAALNNSLDKVYFSNALKEMLLNGIGNIAVENNDIIGYLIFNCSADRANSPLYGYGINHTNRAEIISKLFQHTAAKLCENLCQSIRVNVICPRF